MENTEAPEKTPAVFLKDTSNQEKLFYNYGALLSNVQFSSLEETILSEGFLRTEKEEFVYNPDTKATSQKGSVEYINVHSDFSSKLIRTSSGELLGVLFSEVETN